MSSPHQLVPGVFYHIYNRGNNRENIFIEERNYIYFIHLYAKHIEPVAETYAYCLLKNHFHALVHIKDDTQIASRAFSNFFNAYAKAINKAYGRTGSLFQHPFGRIQVNTSKYRLQLIQYIHRNPQKHGFVNDFRDWPYSSFHSLSARVTSHAPIVCQDAVLNWFGDLNGFVKAHDAKINKDAILRLAPDDFD